MSYSEDLADESERRAHESEARDDEDDGDYSRIVYHEDEDGSVVVDYETDGDGEEI